MPGGWRLPVQHAWTGSGLCKSSFCKPWKLLRYYEPLGTVYNENNDLWTAPIASPLLRLAVVPQGATPREHDIIATRWVLWHLLSALVPQSRPCQSLAKSARLKTPAYIPHCISSQGLSCESGKKTTKRPQRQGHVKMHILEHPWDGRHLVADVKWSTKHEKVRRCERGMRQHLEKFYYERYLPRKASIGKVKNKVDVPPRQYTLLDVIVYGRGDKVLSVAFS